MSDKPSTGQHTNFNDQGWVTTILTDGQWTGVQDTRKVNGGTISFTLRCDQPLSDEIIEALGHLLNSLEDLTVAVDPRYPR